MATSAWDVQAVREAEAAAMALLPEGRLMRRAATGLARVLAARAAQLGSTRVVGLVGSGGNGGDTLYALARLARKGQVKHVAAVLTSPRGAHPGGLARARRDGVVVVDAAPPPSGPEADRGPGGPEEDREDRGPEAAVSLVARADLVVDGITGIGGSPGWSASAAPLLRALVDAIRTDAYVVAVDLPSGADPAGEDLGSEGVWADETVTFGVGKPVHVLGTAPRCGLLTVVDIGLDLDPPPAAQRLDHDDAATLWPRPGPDDDKYRRGVLGVVAGGEVYPGAALLAVTAAVEAGAGMVRYVGPPTPTGLVRAAVPEAVFGPSRVEAWVVGPGLTPHPPEWDTLGLAQVDAARAALDSGEPAVVDAGGLDLLTGPRPQAGARTLLTPHAGELARLLRRLDPDASPGLDAAAVAAAPLAHARRAADLLHATVLLKGSTTYVVPPPGRGLPVRAQADAPAWLATAGAGDVLAGLAGALLAAGLDPLDAGSLAALVHGLAGHEANPGGPVRALRVAHSIPPVVARLLRRRPA